ncbi:OBAP family protein [Massilia sp. TS11]|uniref:OBAP family protein n=1 Tax=Massilia sp. TS11 TaxID=2908003 RepID=UPI001EDB7702|nr:OBAP family protein [Massilia sp. TS11]MCG2586782.1 OBAP family protein [Massilia sp. TS11]
MVWHRVAAVLALVSLCLLTLVMAQEKVAPPIVPPGAPTSARTGLLERGADLLQSARPVQGFDIYLSGFHPLKAAPQRQMEAHHYCHQVNEDFAQCVLFDANTAAANLTGVEFIISDKLFAGLPAAERAFWHPHNGEILSGQLQAPGIPRLAEHALMRQKLNSYGKTWHFWHSGVFGEGADPLPFGEPVLAWSFNRDGEAAPGLVEGRDKRLGLSTAVARQNRQDLQALALPQQGADALRDSFGRPTLAIPGVRPP